MVAEVNSLLAEICPPDDRLTVAQLIGEFGLQAAEGGLRL